VGLHKAVARARVEISIPAEERCDWKAQNMPLSTDCCENGRRRF
jgi:hypothetical protein